MRIGCVLLFTIALLSGCGGGGGGGGAGTTPLTPTPTPQQTPSTAPPSTTNASGTVVDDGTGAPLAGVKVVLEPWVAGATPLPSPQSTTDASGNFTLNGAPNGHYLLVIGNDTPGQTSTAVVHDNVTLGGANQILAAPTLPTIPGYSAPAWETNGKYRIATLDPTNEVPCFTAWNSDRAAHSLGAAVPDEWLTENARAQWAYTANGSVGVLPPNSGSITFLTAGTLGDANCSQLINAVFSGSVGASSETAALSSNQHWFGAKFESFAFSGSSNTAGDALFPYDPRFQTDPDGNWP